MSIKDKFLTKEEILKADDIVIEVVEVPEWGGSVHVKTMSGTERDSFESEIVDIRNGVQAKTDTKNIRAKICARSICDEDGKLLFTEKEAVALGKKSVSALQRVFQVSQRLSRISDDDIEDFAKALEEDPFDGSASDSP